MKYPYLLLNGVLYLCIDDDYLNKRKREKEKNTLRLTGKSKFVKLSSPLAGNIREKILNAIKGLVELYNELKLSV
ncbi:MAG: hypothetical protein UT24_C0016G0028 [Candidatus Woesebacteria bacterium GW2011_GWB1_39_12]|uniref:Uncharacterized protein n=1 Tax=Candidatus Woesebacteria bacterium GW2011_GWB1_39_12 TaxID=1618574 RepID=A0A0G0M7P4_9BACT|nr:MAG: hypothetical protein UT24_C0016G0028 [Candidatus Woesebacteria bacterium GW2011_GWB1_39_12]